MTSRKQFLNSAYLHNDCTFIFFHEIVVKNFVFENFKLKKKIPKGNFSNDFPYSWLDLDSECFAKRKFTVQRSNIVIEHHKFCSF